MNAPRPLPHSRQQLIWQYGAGTTLRMVRYIPGGSVYLQNIGEDDNGVIELPPELLEAIADGLKAMASAGSTS